MLPKIVAFVGQAHSGKNTAASYLIKNHNYIEVAFADKLKDVVSKIFELDRNKLNNSKFKETPHPYLNPLPTWKVILYKATGINLSPKNGVTPREILQMLGGEEGLYNDPRHYYALNKLRASPKLIPCIKEVYNFSKDAPLNEFSELANNTLWIVSFKLGYVGFRYFNKDTWLNYAFIKINNLIQEGHRVVVTDCRYKNEAEALYKNQASLIYIDRPSLNKKLKLYQHSSENFQDFLHLCDFRILNDYDKTHLFNQLKYYLYSTNRLLFNSLR